MLADRLKVYGCIVIAIVMVFSLIIIPAGLGDTGNVSGLRGIAIGLSIFWGLVILTPIVLAVKNWVLKKKDERVKPLRPLWWFFKPNVDRMEKKRDSEGLAEALFYKRDPIVRRKAAEALGRVGEGGAWALAQAVFDKVDEVGQSALAVLQERGASAVDSITAMIALSYFLPEENERERKAHQNIRTLAFAVLGKLGAPTVPPLIASLGASEALMSKAAAVALGYVLFTLQDSALTAKSMPPLIAALQDEKETVREGAGTALGMASDEQALQPLIAALDDSSATVRAQVRDALDTFGWKPSAEMLAAEFSDLFTQYTLEAAHDQFVAGQTVIPEKLAEESAEQIINRAGAVLMEKYGLSAAEVAQGLSKVQELAPSPPSIQPEDQQDVDILVQLCDAYATNDTKEIARLEPLVRQIGEKLNGRGGLVEMQRVFALLGGRRGSRTLEMHWGGIGEWRG
jgi:HEAT repeat protein